MADFKHNGFTYEKIVRPWRKGKSRVECIKWVTGFRNLWERITIEEYESVKK